MMETKYFLTDIRRLFKEYRFYLSIIGVTLSLLFSLESFGIINNNVVSTYMMSTELSGIMVAYVFCAFPYALSLCESMEQKYIRYEVVRGNLKRFVISKVVVIYLSSMITMIAGTILFVLIIRWKVPWVDMKTDSQGISLAGQYSCFMVQGNYFLYCVVYAAYLGMLAGTMSVLAAFVSMYISNKVTVLAVPLLAYQILLDYAGRSMFTVFSFRIYNKLFESDLEYFMFVTMLSMVPVILLTVGIYRKIKCSF